MREPGRLDEKEFALFRTGNHRVFRRVVDECSPRLLVITTSYARDSDDALDLLQETWLRAYRKREQFTGRGSLIGWLYTVCRTVCLDARRKWQPPEPLADDASATVIHCKSSPVEDPGHRVHLRQALYHALADLPERERDVTILRLVEGYSTKETADRLGCATGTVKATLNHALRKLQISMEGWADE